MEVRSVIELVFENGILTAESDRSEKVAEFRKMVLNSENDDSTTEPTQGEIANFVERAFDRQYRRGI